MMCRGRLRPPLIIWHVTFDEELSDDDVGDDFGVRYICGRCATSMCDTLHADMKKIGTARKVGQLGFHRAAKQAAVSGRFLWTGETAKQ